MRHRHLEANVRKSASGQHRNRTCRLMVGVLAAGPVLFGVPVAAFGAEGAPEQETKAVHVNRTPPKVGLVPMAPAFSAWPTEEEMFRAHVFEEPLVVALGPPTPAETRALARAVMAYQAGGGGEKTEPFEAILEAGAVPAWRASLLLNLGLTWERTGRPSRALSAFAESWALARSARGVRGRAVADRAVAELAQLLARLGRVVQAKKVLDEVVGRDIGGTAAERLQQAREGVDMMRTQKETAFRCGPIALQRLLAHGKPYQPTDPRILEYRSSPRGTTLRQMRDLARAVGRSYRAVKRVDPSGGILAPALVHWSVGHFAALAEERDGRYLLKDPVFGHENWISRRAYDEEASGYALVDSQRSLPWGWREVADDEADEVWGRGNTAGRDPEDQTPCDPKSGGDQGSCGCSCRSAGMASFAVHSMLVSLNMVDTPLGYSPPRGPAVQFTVTYNQRDSFQPQTFAYWNLGTRWTADWLGYITDDPTDGTQPVSVYIRGGGQETHTGYDPATGSYPPHRKSQAVVVRVSASPVRYERRMPDGSFEEYAQPDGTLAFPRKVFLTRVVDAQGHALVLTYDETLRLLAATDAVGQVTTLSYGQPGDPLKLTKVTDPFGRFARFEYDGQGRLRKITDVIGIESQLEYGAADFVDAVTTPRGRSGFTTGGQGTDRWIELSDALGGRERIESRDQAPIPDSEPVTPIGFNTNHYLAYRNTFYWDKRAYALGRGDYTKAQITHWLHTPDHTQTSGTKESEKKPLENRVFYLYPGQGSGGVFVEGTSSRPIKVGRVLDDGTTQLHQYEYNAIGLKTREIDPLGRETVYVYGTDNVPDAYPIGGTSRDLLQVKQKNAASPGGWDTLSSYTYNGQHQVLVATDAAGQTTHYSYTASGQVQTVTNAKDEATTYTYDSEGRLLTVSGPVAGTTTTHEYDGYGRLWKVTDPEGYWTTTEYDTFDRPTKVTYPDGTWKGTVYENLDAVRHRDRMGRWTQTFYDELRRPVATKDAAGRLVQQEYCATCGSAVEKLVDANGNATSWGRDLQGRVTTEARANGLSYTTAFETTTSRLKSVTDPKGNVKTHAYNLDDTLAGISYTVAAGTAPTPNVAFTYDAAYGRVSTMTDGTGTTTYAYYPVTSPPTLGAGKLRSVDGPLANDTIEYAYDELGRVTSRQIGSAANTQTQAFDTQGRLTTLTNPLGAFTYTYEGNTGRPASLTYPNGQQTTWSYLDNANDRRLREIHNKRPGGATLSRFEYTYDKAGNILTWLQQADSDPAKMYHLGYDNADQLTAAILKTTDPTPAVLKRYYYAYDSAGNRTAEQIDDAVTGASYNNMNQLVSQQAGGALVFKGTVSEPANVSVGGKPATVTADNRFEGQAVVPGGTGQVAVTATDPSGNVRRSTYQVSQGASNKSFTYDANGNMTSDGTRTYEWDAENRLVAVKEGGSTVTSYTYGGNGLRVSKATSGGTTRYVLDGASAAEERASDGTVIQHFRSMIDYAVGMRDNNGNVTYVTHDHLRSVREQLDQAGVVQRFDYDPWGRLLSSANVSGPRYGNREWDADAELYHYRARYYAPAVARFLSADPIGLRGGTNLHSYVRNNPLRYIDPFGMLVVTIHFDYFPGLGDCQSDWGCIAPSYRLSISCDDCGMMDILLELSGVIRVRPGDYQPLPIIGAPLDPNVVDEESAKKHERQHLYDIADMATLYLEQREHQYPSRTDCEAAKAGIERNFSLMMQEWRNITQWARN